MIMRTLFISGATLVLLAGSAFSQGGTRVWPVAYANQPGGEQLAAPFTLASGNRLPTARSVTTLKSWSVPFGPGSSIDRIAWRRESVTHNNYSASSGQLEVRVGLIRNAKRPSQTLARLFEDGSSKVFGGSINLPSASSSKGRAAAFQLSVPFATPWNYAGGDFAIDLHFKGSTGTKWLRDAVTPGREIHASFEQVGGRGCFGSNGFAPLTWCELDRAVPGGEFVMHLQGAPSAGPTGTAMWMLGAAGGSFAGLPLPISLGMFGGREDCELRLNVLQSGGQAVADRSSMFSRSRMSIPIPSDNSTIGAEVTAQWAVLDEAIGTAVPRTTSNAITVKIGASPPTGSPFYGRSLWNYGMDLSGGQGFQRSAANLVPVIQFSGNFAN